MRDNNGYQLIDWDCNPKYYADQLNLNVWRKEVSYPKNAPPNAMYFYDIYFQDKTSKEMIERYYSIHWDYISVILSFGIKIKELTTKK